MGFAMLNYYRTAEKVAEVVAQFQTPSGFDVVIHLKNDLLPSRKNTSRNVLRTDQVLRDDSDNVRNGSCSLASICH